LGSEALMHGSVAEQPLIIKADTDGDISHLNSVSQVYAPTSLVKLFDAQTGAAITGDNA